MAQKLSYAERVRNVHIPSSSSTFTTDPEFSPPKHPSLPSFTLASKPVVNVWNARMEKMAAIRAAQKIPAQDTSPSKSSPTEVDTDDPFVVRLPDHLRSAPPIAGSLPFQAGDKTQDNGQQGNWPHVGELVSISASPSDSSITDDGAKDVDPNSSSPRKTEKTKWVSIPKQELQAAADAASASTSKRPPNSRRPRATTIKTDPNLNTSANGIRASTSTSAHSLSQSRTPSVHTSASHSRAESLQSSPKLARNGKKLPPESDNQGPTSGSDGADASLQANSIRLPKQDGGHRHESDHDSSRVNNESSARNQRASSSRPRSQTHPTSAHGYSATSSEPAHLPLPTNQPQPFLPTAPVFQHSQLNHDHNSPASNSSSPRVQQLHPLPPSSIPASVQSLHHHLQTFPHAAHGQSTYPHAPYPLYNLSLSPMNSYDYVPTDIVPRSSHYLPYPPPPALPNYGQSGSDSLLNGMEPVRTTGRSRGSPAETSDLSLSKSNDGAPAPEKMIFGSIDVSSNLDDAAIAMNAIVEEERKEEKKKPFAIGIETGHDLPGRLRPSQKKTAGRATGGRPPSVKDKSDEKDEKDKRQTREDKEDDSASSASAVAPKVSSVEPRWTFGTTSILPSPPPPTSSGVPSPLTPSQLTAKLDTPTEDDIIKASFTQPTSAGITPFVLEAQGSSSFLNAPSNIPVQSPIAIQPSANHHPYHIHLHRMPSPTDLGSVIPLPPQLSIPVQMALPLPTASSNSDPDLEVKDYGFGFGDASGLGYAPIIVKERAREWEAERARERAVAEAGDIQALGFNNEDVITSPITESASREGADKDNIANDQSLPREHIQPREYYARGRRLSNARGGYGDRGAGSYRRARGGMNGFPRGFGRGGYGSHYIRGGPGGISPVNPRGGPSSPFNVTPPHHFQTLPLDSSGAPTSLPPPLGGFYPPHPHHPNPGRPYIPPGYEAFNPSPTIAGVPPPLPVDPAGVLHRLPQAAQAQGHQGQILASGKPPVPVPMTTIPFPLDSTRYYLLGQLEYYLSPENMAQDFYLRQQMDARGWIPISLIASFNRVRHLTQDVQLVRDVLTLSSLVQVRGNMVRMGGWEPFVLPDSAPSTVEEQPLPYPYQNLTNYYFPETATTNTAVNGEVGAVGYPELPHATAVRHNISASDIYDIKWGDASMVNGHAQDVEEDDEDEVEIVMGQGVGTFMYDRRTASS